MSFSSDNESNPSSSLHSLLFQIKSVDWDYNAAGGKEEWKQTLEYIERLHPKFVGKANMLRQNRAKAFGLAS